ncbi:MAG TPA: potassium transporter Kup [Glycomyces sp.]|nr:potassium transporter Kup [Glycomyces sp.]
MTAQIDASPSDPAPGPQPASAHSSLKAALVVGALGVVFGDIGTSPIYALQTLFNPADPHPVPINDANVFGLISLIFWSMMIVVTVFYVMLAMRADNDGEGGIMALITLIRRHGRGRGRRTTLTLAGLGIFGAALFLGDSMITPAISVLSAVEGLNVVEPELDAWVVPITAVIILALFVFQRKGTATIGRLFGPVMIVWFAVLAALGIGGIGHHPDILKALSPAYAIGFLAGHFHIGFFALAAVVLTFTGAEALYADMGHFGRKAITSGWIFLVFPALLLNYMGQGALILEDPSNTSGPFFLLAPGWGRVPLLLLATAATVIASQAVITGAYSVASQASKLGYLPRLRIAHTSEQHIGQIYVPWINWLLMVSVLTLVFAFRSSAALAYAYGMAVVGTITIVTLLFFYVARTQWGTPKWLVFTGGGLLLAFDLLFLAANTTKFVHGAWLPLVIGVTAFSVMVTWQRGREIVTAERARREGPLRAFLEKVREGEPKAAQVPGTAVFLNRGLVTAPLALRANMERNHVRHAQIVVLSVETEPVPRIPAAERVVVNDLGFGQEGIIHVTARFGYMDAPDVPAALRLVKEHPGGRGLKLRDATYFLSTIQLRGGKEPTMANWRKKLFIATSHLTADAAEHFRLPRDRTVIVGSQIEF